MSKSRLIERQNAMSAVYTHLVCNQDILEVLEDNKLITNISDFLPRYDLGEEMHMVTLRACERKEIYRLAMNKYLNRWRFERLGYIEQAILLVACSELELGTQDRVVVVNEAIRLSKEFAEEDSYKLINGVLDAI